MTKILKILFLILVLHISLYSKTITKETTNNTELFSYSENNNQTKGMVVDYKIINVIVSIFIIILFVLLFFLRKISINKNKTLKINDELNITVLRLEKTQYALQEQKNLFEALFKSTSDGLTLIENGRIIDCNYSLLKMYKIKDKEELKNRKPGTLLPYFQPDGQKSKERVKKYFELCEQYNYATFESLVKKTTGEEFWVNVILVKIETNGTRLVYSILRDISKRKILENEVIQRTNDLENSNQELEKSNIELQSTIRNLNLTQNKLIDSEKMASLGELVAGVAHEINTPIGIGLTGTTHLEDITLNINKKYEEDLMSQDDFEEYLNTSKELSSLININLNKAASLVKSFKQVAVDQTSEEKRVFNLSKYLNEILRSINSVIKKTNIEVKITCSDNIEINSFAGSYSQVITNLIMNSIIHGFNNKSEGIINIDVYKDNNILKIIYKDNGYGIKEKNLKKIFDPFFTTNRDAGGSGLGLNIIYNIVTSKLDGTITCISKENEGVVFTIIIDTHQ